MEQSCKLIILPTNKLPQSVVKKVLYKSGRDGRLHYSLGFVTSFKDVMQFLYTLSNEKIKEGDHYLHQDVETGIWALSKAERDIFEVNNQFDLRFKIIASTDESLGLPKIPDDFIKEYVSSGGIHEIMVEHEEFTIDKDIQFPIPIGCSNFSKGYKLKVLSDNTIIINPVTEKTYTKAQVIELIELFNLETLEQRDKKSLDNWIKESL